MDVSALRDHAADMLLAIVDDLRTPQSSAEQAAKSKGNAPELTTEEDTAAEIHGAGRAESGFTVAEMVSEYRALRASVIRLWTKANGSLDGADIGDLMRFNETIDQALAESITRYTQDLDRSKEMFVAILGHDLRTPISAVTMASQYMLDTGELEEPHLSLTSRIAGSARRMDAMVSDLLDFTRSRLGSGVPIVCRDMDLATSVRQAIDELTAARPASRFSFAVAGDLCGVWDAARISQVVSNLLGNAALHGAPEETVHVSAQGEPDEVVLRVQNGGKPIPRGELPTLFSPFKRLSSSDAAVAASNHLGLGLYIAERIVVAHGGSISVRSSVEAGTLFTVRLPRGCDASPRG